LTCLCGNTANFRSTEGSCINPRRIFVPQLTLLFDERLEGRGVMLTAVERRGQELLLARRVDGTHTTEPRVGSSRLFFVCRLAEDLTT